MDYNQAFAGLVESLSAQILESVTAKVDSDIKALIDKRITESKIDEKVNKAAHTAAVMAVKQYEPDLSKIDAQLTESTSAIVRNITTTAEKLVKSAISDKISAMDFEGVATKSFENIVTKKLTDFDFPPGSIQLSAISYNTKMSGDNVTGGIITNFASTGIDDKSSSVQLTVLDSHTVIENELFTKDLTIKNTTTLDGDIYLNGNVVTTSPGYATLVSNASKNVINNLNDEFFTNYSNIIFESIKDKGIDLNKVTLNGVEIFKNGGLATGITTSNLKKVGVLDDLQVKGESLVANTLFVTNRRIGINTLEPHSALTMWDEEIEISMGKKQNGIGQIGSTRNQSIALTTNSKNNILLNPDGSVTIAQLNLGPMSLSSSATPPNYNATKGSVVFNANPSLGGPLGWVSLGDARWANFGIIE